MYLCKVELKAVYKDIWKLGYPIMVGSLAQNLIGATDMIILGWVGETEFAASGLISTFYLILVMIGFAISRGGQILISRRIGAGNYHQAGFWVRHLMYLELGMALVLFLTIFFFSRQILALFITNKDIYEASLLYLDYRIFGLFFSCLSFVYMALYTSIGRTGIIAVITIALFIINAGLNYLLVFGVGPFPEMGIAGSGLASTIAEVVCTGLAFIWICYDRYLKPLQLFNFEAVNFVSLKRLFNLSFPIIVQYIMGLGGWFLLFSIIESLGKRALSVSTVVKMVYTFYSIPAWGMASAANALVSNIIGQQKHSRVFIAIYRTIIVSVVITIVLCLSLVLFPAYIAHIFTQDTAIAQAAIPLFYPLIFILLASAVSAVIFNGLMGTGAVIYSLLIEMFSIIVYLGYAVALVKWVTEVQLWYVWMAEFIYWTLLAILAWAFLKRSNREDFHI